MDFDAALQTTVQDEEGRTQWRDVVFAAEAGYRFLTLDVTLPLGAGPFPLVIFIHGGAWLAGHPAVTNPTYRKLNFITKLLDAGYAVSRISYRFSSEAQFPAQLYDCKAAVRFLRANASTFQLDPKRFAVMGDSAGGHLAALVGLTCDRADLEGDIGKASASSAVQAVVNWFGPAELLTMQSQRIDPEWSSVDDPKSPESRLIGGPVQQNPAKAKAASPTCFAHKSAPPFLIQHGTLDRLVPYQQSVDLAAALKNAGADVTLLTVEGADHCFWGVPPDGIVEDTIRFLDTKL
ncbi:MAG: alpha/beta hydrolase [Alphaproteobacteria bacterium]|nr:alpha/beta hydrolase [Alphaproteobacteria bacterium]